MNKNDSLRAFFPANVFCYVPSIQPIMLTINLSCFLRISLDNQHHTSFRFVEICDLQYFLKTLLSWTNKQDPVRTSYECSILLPEHSTNYTSLFTSVCFPTIALDNIMQRVHAPAFCIESRTCIPMQITLMSLRVGSAAKQS